MKNQQKEHFIQILDDLIHSESSTYSKNDLIKIVRLKEEIKNTKPTASLADILEIIKNFFTKD